MKFLSTVLLASVALAIQATTLLASSAHDDASQAAYADGWDDGDNGGTGFGPWSLAFNGDASSLNPVFNSDPHFIDGVGVGPLAANQLGAPAFGMTATGQLSNQTGSVATVAERSFNEAMKIGQTFRVDIDSSALEGNSRIGNLFELLGADGVSRYTLRTSLGSLDDNWSINGTETNIPAGDAFRVSVTLTDTDTFSGSVSSLNAPTGTFSLNSPLLGTAGESIVGLRLSTFGTGSSTDGARELFFDNLELTRTDVVPEPGTMALALLGISMCGLTRRKDSGVS